MKTKDSAHFHIVLVKGWIQRDGHFLMAQRSHNEVHAAGTWSLPGGKVEDDNEDKHILEHTLQKEIAEEVGVQVEDDMELIYNNSFVRSDGAHVVNLTFLCRYRSGEAVPLEDTIRCAWFTIDELMHFEEAEDFMKREIRELKDYLARHG